MHFSARKSPSVLPRVLLFILAISIAALALYVTLDNGRVVAKRVRVTISNMPQEFEGYTILQISDLAGRTFEANQRAIKTAVTNASYNIVVLTGDVIGSGESDAFISLVKTLGDTKPIYYILGDADPKPNYANPSDPYNAANNLGAIHLDATTAVTHKNKALYLTPENMILDNTPSDTLAEYERELASVSGTASSSVVASINKSIDALREEIDIRQTVTAGDVHIAITHKPLDADKAAIVAGFASDPFYSSIDLFVAGHLAGGTWRLPGVGAIYVRGMGFFPNDTTGLMYVNGFLQVISGGLSASSDTPFPPFRLFNTPEVTLITLTRELVD